MRLRLRLVFVIATVALAMAASDGAARDGGSETFLVCNSPPNGAKVTQEPHRCTVLPPQASFAEGANLVGLKWSRWGSQSATFTGFERGFHLPLQHIAVHGKAFRPRLDQCGGRRLLYTRIRSTSRYGTTIAKAQTCSG